ncbi:hypothetical protein [Bradyrhizobium sp.]|uniref:hypothetical protein n=1 Tax=Bradyrhizobium sp. TaxID=376 RepID=UPI003C66093D
MQTRKPPRQPQTAAPVAQQSWAVVRYAPDSGDTPEDDAAAFDGWYSDRNDAIAVASGWAASYPQWIVGIVESDLIWIGNGDFGAVQDRPLIAREQRFLRGTENPVTGVAESSLRPKRRRLSE